ncbi:hypothetical protein [Salinicola socius]|uniref:hypothetical protein n=1 Tax=Salinicola socius TaxID=404433 RepID=UPI0009FE14C3|nr:hypothetical protein [Salinicola socius]
MGAGDKFANSITALICHSACVDDAVISVIASGCFEYKAPPLFRISRIGSRGALQQFRQCIRRRPPGQQDLVQREGRLRVALDDLCEKLGLATKRFVKLGSFTPSASVSAANPTVS